MEYFVDKDSIVRKIWGNGDTILFIFAGASAEFALNKAVDWLYYTGRLPQDPLGRLFSTVSYARDIVFSEKNSALEAIGRINSAHAAVEKNRGAKIPDWAYRDVLFMLIDYSIRSFELLERQLTLAEKQEVFDVFYRVGKNMKLKDLPQSFEAYEKMRNTHLQQHLYRGDFSRDLFKQYRKHLGFVRYRLLLETQNLICPKKVRHFLGFWRISLLKPVIFIYKFSRNIKLDWLLKELILPSAYKKEIRALDNLPA
ncbi:oxygenase MpaB family protein [Zunongwangia sp. F363]|uniref:Oxygenase MpaB family protein n=1 Tax=Autumnicola tepida TaxID=3075595 RepID=A0ABU3CA42_9FLAO|nr:oxygenase MpaB family protein [Zunongwangia sp. F363]MDT0643202.1 oxygenase MpaB family protein [Zunongwangia sp. F363]